MSKGESHRIYWQQWLQTSTTSPAENGDHNNANQPRSRRELITSSAAVRISPIGARAKDVTDLLRQSLKIEIDEQGASYDNSLQTEDSLVLVGTLYSMPKDYVRFEHEQQQRRYSDQSTIDNTKTKINNRSDPFHVVRTLEPMENPLVVRDVMVEHLEQLQRSCKMPSTKTNISPKLQWYYVPSDTAVACSIPNCVDLDGYCTSMEDEGLSDEDNEESQHDNAETDTLEAGSSHSALSSKFPWLVGGDDEDDYLSQLQADPELRAEELRFHQLLEQSGATFLDSAAPSSRHCMSGYLLKRSRKDRNVWRRVHCVLTNDYLWFVSRIHTKSTTRRPFARHGRIRLTRALLLEPAIDYAPLYRTPYSFEVVSAKGTSHVFRTINKRLQTTWMQTLSERIVQSYENSLLDNAELIVADECLAQSRRVATAAVESQWETSGSISTPLVGQPGAVLRWGLQVAEFRENCRYTHSMLPAKSPVVASSSSASSIRIGLQQPLVPPNDEGFVAAPADPAVLAMIRSCWDQATSLLARATHMALQFREDRMPSSLETLCRHVDYVITGRFRPVNGDAVESPSDVAARDRDRSPPPVDLFDHLLAELQSHAAQPGPEASATRAKEDEPDQSTDVDAIP